MMLAVMKTTQNIYSHIHNLENFLKKSKVLKNKKIKQREKLKSIENASHLKRKNTQVNKLSGHFQLEKAGIAANRVSCRRLRLIFYQK